MSQTQGLDVGGGEVCKEWAGTLAIFGHISGFSATNLFCSLVRHKTNIQIQMR